jgi:hypothetical protein
MGNRKRVSAQPMLEQMEPRVVLSTAAVHGHAWKVVAADVGRTNDSVRLAEASQRQNNVALARLQSQLHLIHVRSLERTPSALPTAAEQRASKLSNFFKTVSQSL